MTEKIRAVVSADTPALKQVLDSCELFPSEYLDAMISDYLDNPESEELWFTYVENGQPAALGYCVPEKLAEGTYNLLAIGVSAEHQRKGIAGAMMAYIEKVLKDQDGRILLVETSSDDAQTAARNLYRKIGYTQAALLPDFWKDGEDKVVFMKRL